MLLQEASTLGPRYGGKASVLKITAVHEYDSPASSEPTETHDVIIFPDSIKVHDLTRDQGGGSTVLLHVYMGLESLLH